MKAHILIEKAYRYDIQNENIVPKGCTYQSGNGYWVTDDTQEVLMLSNQAPKSVSKKCDRETGEDKKGE